MLKTGGNVVGFKVETKKKQNLIFIFSNFYFDLVKNIF